jgi:hypothetical protein
MGQVIYFLSSEIAGTNLALFVLLGAALLPLVSSSDAAEML